VVLRCGSILALVVFLLATFIVSCFANDYLLVVLGDPSCPACASLKEFLSSEGLRYVFCPLYRNSTCTFAMSLLINRYGVPPYIPVTLVVSRGVVKAVVVGVVKDSHFWYSLTSMKVGNRVPLYMGKEFSGWLNVSPKELLITVMPSLAVKTRSGSVSSAGGVVTSLPLVIGALVGLALSDAVNPCATYIYILLLTASTIAATRSGRRLIVAGTSAAFISAVFTGYYLLGVGLLKAMSYVPAWILSIIAIGFGLWVVITGVVGESRVIAKSSIISMIRRAKTSILMSAILGFIVTFTLLPCSSGPYVVFTGLIAKYPVTTSLALLALYNIIFVSPLILITVLITSVIKVKRIQEAIVRHNKELSVIAGLLLIAIGTYIILVQH